MLYFLLPLFIYPLSLIALTKVSRDFHPLFVSFLRQFSLGLLGFPLFFLEENLFVLLQQNIWFILGAGFFGALYLFCVFKSVVHIEVIKSKIITTVVRILFSIFIGFLFLNESLSLLQVGGIMIIIGALFGFLRIKNNNHHIQGYHFWLGFFLSFISGILFVLSGYFFKLYSQNFSSLFSGYLLELSSVPFLLLFLGLSYREKNLKTSLSSINWKTFFFIFIVSAPVLLGSYGLAQSYKQLDFIVVNILFCATLVVSGLLARFFLKEKITILQTIIFILILLGILMVNLL